MKKLVTLVLLALSVASCSGCAKKVPPPEVVEAGPTPTPTVQPPPVVTTQLIKGDTWEFTLPSKDWSKPTEAPDEVTVYINPGLANMVFFEKIPVGNATLDAVVLGNLRGMKNKGADIHSAKQTELNGTKFVLTEASKGPNTVWIWIGVKDGSAYALSCGGDTQQDHKALCTGIANTLKLH